MTRIVTAAINAPMHPTATTRKGVHLAPRQLRWDFSEVPLVAASAPLLAA